MSKSTSVPAASAASTGCARRAVEIAVHLGPFEQLAVLAHAREALRGR